LSGLSETLFEGWCDRAPPLVSDNVISSHPGGILLTKQIEAKAERVSEETRSERQNSHRFVLLFFVDQQKRKDELNRENQITLFDRICDRKRHAFAQKQDRGGCFGSHQRMLITSGWDYLCAFVQNRW
jgi:hypothetical protein